MRIGNHPEVLAAMHSSRSSSPRCRSGMGRVVPSASESTASGGRIPRHPSLRELTSSGERMEAPSSILIEDIQPQVDCGRYPIKREVGDAVEVTADIFRDGHDLLAAWSSSAGQVTRTGRSADGAFRQRPVARHIHGLRKHHVRLSHRRLPRLPRELGRRGRKEARGRESTSPAN